MADKNIKVVNFDQLELLLKYAVALTDANASGKFLQSDQYFLSTEGGKLTIYNGAGTVKYDSSSAFSVLEYVKKVEWWGSDKEHDQYSHTFIGQDDEGQSTEYHIEKIEKIDSSESTTYLPYIRIGANVYKIPVTTLNGSANNAPSFYAPTDAGTSGQYLTSSGAGAPIWASFPAFIASISYDSTNYRYRFLQSDGDYFDIPQADWNAAEGSGSFIRNKPSIPAAQVNSDWNAASGVAEILNKPTIPTITLNGSATTTPSFYAPTSAGSTAGQYLKWDGSAAVWDTFPTIPTITLNGSATTSPSFYAVTSAGSTAGQYLKWDGSAIVWDNFPTIPDAVSGTADGNNWATITIGSETHNIPSGGSGAPSDYIKSMSAVNNTLSWTEVVNGTESQQSYTFSGGGGGTSNYADLNGKPQIGGVELASGNNTLAALGLQALIDASHKLDYSLLANTPTIPDAVSGTNDGTNWTTITIGSVTKNIPAGGEPASYIKDASVSNGVLTLTKKDDSTVTFTASQIVFSGAAVNSFTCASIANGHAFLWTGRHNGQGGIATIVFTDSQFGLELEANFNNGSPWIGSKVTFTKNSNTSISTTANWDWGGNSDVTTTAFVMLY